MGVTREGRVEVQVRQVDPSATTPGLYISSSLHTHLCILTATPGEGKAVRNEYEDLNDSDFLFLEGLKTEDVTGVNTHVCEV